MSDIKKIPIGVDDFEEMITADAYYVDKTDLIRKLLDSIIGTTLFTRPRRFGKSLNLSMLKHFFEMNYELKLSEIKERMKDGYDEYTATKVEESGAKYLDKNPNNSKFAYLFKGLKIMYAGEKYLSQMGKYPVIMLNFKSAKQIDFESSYYKLKENIVKEFRRHEQILETGMLKEQEVEKYKEILKQTDDMNLFISSVNFLSSCLEKVYGQKAIILIDEYDVPLENAYFGGFYDKMTNFIRGTLELALKTNTSVAFSVITGCLRIAKESIFTGLNHLNVVSINTGDYGEYFGFTKEEVKEMLKYYDKSHHMEKVKDWYDGYIFGGEEVYNPWSVLNYVKNAIVNDNEPPAPYWSNTSSNSIVKDLVERADEGTISELDELIEGKTIEKELIEDVTYMDMYENNDNLWNFLYFTGYMKGISKRFDEDQSRTYLTMKIPNKEVKYIYDTKIKHYVGKKIEQTDMTKLYEATLSGDIATLEDELNDILIESISYFDSSEAFYHGIMVGIYQKLKGYRTSSNEECGNGRADLILIPINYKKTAILFEFKMAKNHGEIEQKADEAIDQIKENKYIEGMHAKYYKNVMAYGVGFCKKNCAIRKL